MPLLPYPLVICASEKGGDPEIIRESQRRRYADVSLVDKVIELDKQWREGAPSREGTSGS